MSKHVKDYDTSRFQDHNSTSRDDVVQQNAITIPARKDLLARDAERQALKMGVEVDGVIVTSCIENSCLQVSGKCVAEWWVRCLSRFDEVMKDLVATCRAFTDFPSHVRSQRVDKRDP